MILCAGNGLAKKSRDISGGDMDEKIVEQIYTEDCERCEKGIDKGF